MHDDTPRTARWGERRSTIAGSTNPAGLSGPRGGIREIGSNR
jgi:hypothetical protein